MKKLNYKDRDIWFGVHKDIGGFIYDKGSQSKLGDNKIRVFKLDSQSSSVFLKKIIKDSLINFDDELYKNYTTKINRYLSLTNKMFFEKRITHCFECKEDINSVDFSICKDCSWITCSCGACGCHWENHDYD